MSAELRVPGPPSLPRCECGQRGVIPHAPDCPRIAKLRAEQETGLTARVRQIGLHDRDHAENALAEEAADRIESLESALRAYEGQWDMVSLEDPGDACCGHSCTPNGCHECHPAGLVVLVATRRYDTPDQARAALVVLEGVRKSTASHGEDGE